MTLRFVRGDRLEVPKRLGGGRGVVAYSWRRNDTGAETCQVARLVDGRTRLTVIPEDELYRLTSKEGTDGRAANG